MNTKELFEQLRKDGQGLSGFQEKVIQALVVDEHHEAALLFEGIRAAMAIHAVTEARVNNMALHVQKVQASADQAWARLRQLEAAIEATR